MERDRGGMFGETQRRDVWRETNGRVRERARVWKKEEEGKKRKKKNVRWWGKTI